MFQSSFTIKSWDFSRNDGLVNVTVSILQRKQSNEFNSSGLKGGGSNQIQSENNQQQQQYSIEEIASSNFVTQKIRIQKIQIQQLKRLLKRPYAIKEFWEFYQLYCEKLIEIDFGKIELFNIQGDNQYDMDELSNHLEQQSFIRWGKVFQLEHLSLEENNQIYRFVKLQYYNQLVRERIFTLRNLHYYKDDERRKHFPYSYLYILDLEDTFHFNQTQLREIFSQIQQKDDRKNMIYTPLILKKDFYQTFFANYNLRNIIIPCLLCLNSDFPQDSIYYFIHVSQQQNNNTFKAKIYIEGIQEDKQQRIQEQFQELLHQIDIELQIDDITFSNFEHGDFFISYVHYIEKTFFKNRQNFQNLMKLYFNDLPLYLSNNPINTPLMKNIVIPDNIEEILQTQGQVDQ